MRHIPDYFCTNGCFRDADDHLDIFVNTDVFELEVATDPQISPDGSTIAYVRATNDIMTDIPGTISGWSIRTAAITGLSYRALPLTPIHAGPMMKPSGLFVSAEGRGPQLYVRWMDTGQSALLSNLQNAPRGIFLVP